MPNRLTGGYGHILSTYCGSAAQFCCMAGAEVWVFENTSLIIEGFGEIAALL